MAERGVHFALSVEQEQKLLAAHGDEAVLEIIEELEDLWATEHLVQSDKAWNGIHRCLTDGELLYDNGIYPLNHCICGGKQLISGEDTYYTVSFVTAAQVHDIAKALRPIDQAWMRERYFHHIPTAEYQFRIDEEDFADIWENFVDIRNFYLRASQENRAVVFTVDC